MSWYSEIANEIEKTLGTGQTIQNLGRGHTNDDMLFIVGNFYLLQ